MKLFGREKKRASDGIPSSPHYWMARLVAVHGRCRRARMPTALPFPPCARSPTPGRSAACGSPTGSCSRRSRASATGSCASRPSASAPAWWSRRWCRASGSPTATSAPSASSCASTPTSTRSSMQLFGHDPDVMREAAAMAADAGADLIDLNMGCPVRKVCKTGAGAALLDDPDKAVAIARAAARGRRPPGDGEAAARARRPASATASSSRGGSWTRPAWPASRSTPATPPSSTPARPTTRSRASWSGRSPCR